MDFAGLIKYIFNLGVSLAGVLAFGVIVYSGIRLLTSAGNPAVMSESKKKDKRCISWAGNNSCFIYPFNDY